MQYHTIPVLGPEQAGTNIVKPRINNAGHILGSLEHATHSFGFLYADDRLVDIFPAERSPYVMLALNNADTMAGYFIHRPANATHWHSACVLQQDSALLIDIPDQRMVMAVDINDDGKVLLQCQNSDSLIYSNNAYKYIAKDDTISSIQSFSINSHGHVTGSVRTIGRGTKAFIYDGKTIAILGFLPIGAGNLCCGLAINDRNHVVGISGDLKVALHAFLYTNEQMIDLGTIGLRHSRARAVNSQDQAVGSCFEGWGPDSASRATLWCNDRIIDLNDFVDPADWSLYEATSINDHGQIVGRGAFRGRPMVFLMTPF